jgi:hypothetical protein
MRRRRDEIAAELSQLSGVIEALAVSESQQRESQQRESQQRESQHRSEEQT